MTDLQNQNPIKKFTSSGVHSLTVATDIGLSGKSIVTRSIAEWKKAAAPELERRPTVFLLLG